MLNSIAILGRPNVGKSSLFNRLTKTRNAIVSDYFGLTKDRNFGHLSIKNQRFLIIDTGGIGTENTEFSNAITEKAIIAAETRATIGEISDTLELVFGRYNAQNSIISGVYKKENAKDPAFQKAKKLASLFKETEGRSPRILIAKMGQDGHDRGAKVVASSFADIGFDVDLGPLFQTPVETAKQAVENDVHWVGVSSLAAGHKTLIPELAMALKNLNRSDIQIIVGGVVPKADYDFLFSKGVVAIFGPGSPISQSASKILKLAIE